MENHATAGLAWKYDGPLLAIGLAGYAAAAVIFALEQTVLHSAETESEEHQKLVGAVN